MKQSLVIFLLIFLWSGSNAFSIKRQPKKPSPAKYGFNPSMGEQDEIDSEIDKWDPTFGTNVWEHSGLYEGDIMIYQSKKSIKKNGLLRESARWPGAIIPFYIDSSFTADEVNGILNAMQEYHNKTCVRFRPFVQGDTAWIDIKQDYAGCWSSVGMKSEGQVVNLGSDKCRRHGVIIHELMHSIGFYHQQSASDRDDYVIVHWENIRSGREHNFNKYNTSIVTSFNVSYDYDSVMHYSSKAFSKNGEITIEPIYEYSVLGQRVGLSEKDIIKINSMYSDSCHNETNSIVEMYDMMQQQQQEVVPSPISENYFESVIKFGIFPTVSSPSSSNVASGSLVFCFYAPLTIHAVLSFTISLVFISMQIILH